ncbi:hypothetical protein [Arenimonas alkanexedens]
MNNLPPMLSLPNTPIKDWDGLADYIQAYAEAYGQQVAAAKDAEIAAMRTERDALAARVAWQPIETAPRDGSDFFCAVLYGNGMWPDLGVGWWTATHRNPHARDGFGEIIAPTHWMPPAAPQNEGEK